MFWFFLTSCYGTWKGFVNKGFQDIPKSKQTKTQSPEKLFSYKAGTDLLLQLRGILSKRRYT